jgi:transcriptional regulator with XRE-family HTH domain
VTTAGDIASIVRVNTQASGKHASSWPRLSFFRWFDAQKKKVEIEQDSEVARLAQLSHTTISAWRHGKQRPSVWPLSAIARVLKVPARVAWAEAGLLTEDDLREMMTPEELDGLDLIEASNLSRQAKDRLKAIHLANVARNREDEMRRVREQIDLLDRD